MNTTKYLIIGNSAAGIAAAEAIRTIDADGSLTMVSLEPYAAYGRPLISYMVEGKTDEAHMNFRDSAFYERNNITYAFGPEGGVVSLDAESHTATLATGDVIGYEKCLIATGSTAFTPDTPGLDEAENVHEFMTLDDAKAAWADAVAATQAAHEAGRESRAVVSGGGLTGLKAAEALSYHVDHVVVVGHNARLLPNALDAAGSDLLKKLLESSHNIEFRTGCVIEKVMRAGDRVTRVLLSDGDELEVDVVVTAAGVRPATKLAVDAGAACGKGIICDERMRTSLVDVYAAGDVTQVENTLTGAKRPLALWTNAMRQGKIAGQNMAGSADAETFTGDYAENAVDFFDVSLLSCGLINPREEDGCVEVAHQEGDTYTKFVQRDGKLVGYILVNRPECAGIYDALIGNEIDLSMLDEGMFERVPRNLDFPEALRWERLHVGFPQASRVQ